MRKIIQLMGLDKMLIALRDDGTVWAMSPKGWAELQKIPQPIRKIS